MKRSALLALVAACSSTPSALTEVRSITTAGDTCGNWYENDNSITAQCAAGLELGKVARSSGQPSVPQSAHAPAGYASSAKSSSASADYAASSPAPAATESRQEAPAAGVGCFWPHSTSARPRTNDFAYFRTARV